MSATEVRSTEAIRREIGRLREQVASSAQALRHRVTDLTDWHSWVRSHPLKFTASALLLGFWLGFRGNPR